MLALFLATFATIDLGFLVANTFKIEDGGWVPLVVGTGLFALMKVWAYGRAALRRQLATRMFPLPEFFASLAIEPPIRVPGLAVFLTGNDGVPLSLLHYLKHAKSLHARVLLLSVITDDVPHVPANERLVVRELEQGFTQLAGHYGYMESPDVPTLLALAKERGVDPTGASFFLGRESIVACRGRWRGWRERLYSIMHHNARPAAEFFGLPPNQVLEVGAQIEI